MSTESIAAHSAPSAAAPPQDAPAQCASCGSPLAPDQRYCLECGERRMPVSSFLQSGPPPLGAQSSPPGSPPAAPPLAPAQSAGRSGTLSVIAGVGVLLLAMGVGVLIGRAGKTKQTLAPAQVITVNGVGSSGAGSAEATFTSSWPSGTSGYTVQLQTLPSTSAVSAVQDAETSASAKGAQSVGALQSEEFSSLPSGNYVVYSGVYHRAGEAQKALAGLRKSFPGASVIHVAGRSSSSSSGAEGSTGSGSGASGVGSSLSHPAPPSVLKSLSKSKGKSYEEKSKNLPDVVSTG